MHIFSTLFFCVYMYNIWDSRHCVAFAQQTQQRQRAKKNRLIQDISYAHRCGRLRQGKKSFVCESHFSIYVAAAECEKKITNIFSTRYLHWIHWIAKEQCTIDRRHRKPAHFEYRQAFWMIFTTFALFRRMGAQWNEKKIKMKRKNVRPIVNKCGGEFVCCFILFVVFSHSFFRCSFWSNLIHRKQKCLKHLTDHRQIKKTNKQQQQKIWKVNSIGTHFIVV